MGKILKAIIVEDVLEEVFSYLPDMAFSSTGEKFPVRFGYGDEKELNVFLANREISDVYPLIWLLYTQKEQHLKTSVKLPEANFILAVTTNQTMEYRERIKLTYGKVLMPLLTNIRLLFNQSNVISIDQKDKQMTVLKYPKFSENELKNKNGTIAIWDALKITVNLDIIQGCIKPIKFF